MAIKLSTGISSLRPMSLLGWVTVLLRPCKSVLNMYKITLNYFTPTTLKMTLNCYSTKMPKMTLNFTITSTSHVSLGTLFAISTILFYRFMAF